MSANGSGTMSSDVDLLQSHQSIVCTDCSICPRRHTCPQGASGKGTLPSHGTNCPVSQSLADDHGGYVELPRTRQRPLYRLEWNAERVKVTRDRLESLSFDPAGRLFSFSTQHSIWRRGLDGRVLEISHIPGDSSKMPACFFHCGRLTDNEEAATWMQWVDDFLREALDVFADHPQLSAARDFNHGEDARAFLEIFRPVGILPPDQYRSLVVQLTHGCSYNKCAFCDFFKRSPFEMKSGEDFRRHVEQAVEYFATSLTARRGVFLGEANAVNIPIDKLLEALEIVGQVFRTAPASRELYENRFDRVCSFVDTFSMKHSVAEWAQAQKLGLDRLYLGVESGSKEILSLLRKPGSAELTLKQIATLKAAGLRVGPIIMTGVGGKEMEEEHLRATADMLNAMQLDSGDRIYLSEFMTVPGSAYETIARERGLTDLTRMECREQSRKLRGMLRFDPPPNGPAVALYDVRQFIY